MIDENGEHDNNDLYALWAVLIGLYLLGTAIVAFGWLAVFLLAAVAAGTWVGIVAYLRSEERRYRAARREIRRQVRWAKRRLRQYR